MILAVMSSKGGVGKTATAVNLAGVLAARGEQVLLIDGDGRASATRHLGLNPRDMRHTFPELLIEGGTFEDYVVLTPNDIDLIPSGPTTMQAELAVAAKEEPLLVVKQLLANPDIAETWKHIILDSQPGYNLISANFAMAAERIILPIALEHSAVQGIEEDIEWIRGLRGNDVKVVAVLQMFDARLNDCVYIAEDVRGRMKKLGVSVVSTMVRRNVAVYRAPAFGISAVKLVTENKEYKRHIPRVEDYADVLEEIMSA